MIYPLFLSVVYCVWVFWWRKQKLQELYQVPGCFVEGLQQSGKSYIKDLIFEKLLGINYSISASGTAFTMIKNGIHYMPINTEDFRNAAFRNLNEVEDVLRKAFDGTPTQR